MAAAALDVATSPGLPRIVPRTHPLDRTRSHFGTAEHLLNVRPHTDELADEFRKSSHGHRVSKRVKMPTSREGGWWRRAAEDIWAKHKLGEPLDGGAKKCGETIANIELALRHPSFALISRRPQLTYPQTNQLIRLLIRSKFLGGYRGLFSF